MSQHRASTARILLLGAVLFLISFSARPAAAQAWTKKMFKEFAHDFGTVARGAEVEHRFEIQNVFKEKIRIKSVRSSCGCTDVSITKKELDTWEKAYVVAKFNTLTFVGQKQATLSIVFDYPYVGEAQLNVRGNIRGDVQFQPGSIDFGQLIQAEPNRKDVQIVKFNDRNWRIVDVKSTFESVRVQLSRPRLTNNGVSYQMMVRLSPDVPTGYVNGELFIVAREYGREIDIPIKFTAKVDSPLQISPQVITIDSKGPDFEFKKKILVKAAEPFRITGIECEDNCFKFNSKSEDAKKAHFVEMVFTGNEQAGSRTCQIQISTDFKGGASGKIKAIINVASSGQPATTDGE